MPPAPGRLLPLVLAALLAGAVACGPAPPHGPLRLSLLAVGDAGAPPADRVDHARMRAVARAMAEEDAERPVDALVFLGDNFYPSGLRRSELLERVAANVAEPFCRFVAPGPRFAKLATACDREPHAVPIFAVLGNHDYDAPESPRLQRRALPRLVANWRMPDGLAETVELGSGVSLVLFDSEQVAAGADTAPLVAALRASAGPWRILAGHRPIATRGPPGQRADTAAYSDAVRTAIARADVDVALVLAGHEHRLAILQMAPPDPPLHAISGGGSNRRKQRADEPNTRAEFESLGFVRVDLVGSDAAGDERLSVSVLRVHRHAWIRAIDDRLLAARYTVDLSGRVREN